MDGKDDEANCVAERCNAENECVSHFGKPTKNCKYETCYQRAVNANIISLKS